MIIQSCCTWLMQSNQSRNCQKEAWKYHKAGCSNTDDAHALIGNLLPHDNDSPLVLDLHERVDMKAAIQEWCKRHMAVINWTSFNAFDLRHHPEWSTTHVMLTQLKSADINQTAKKRFKVMDTSLLTRAELATARPDDIGRLLGMEGTMRVPQKRIRTPVLVACGTFSHYVILEWDEQELVEVSMDPEWRAISKSLANGHKKYKLVNGNPVRRETTFVYSMPIKARINIVAPILELSSHSKLQGCCCKLFKALSYPQTLATFEYRIFTYQSRETISRTQTSREIGISLMFSTVISTDTMYIRAAFFLRLPRNDQECRGIICAIEEGS